MFALQVVRGGTKRELRCGETVHAEAEVPAYRLNAGQVQPVRWGRDESLSIGRGAMGSCRSPAPAPHLSSPTISRHVHFVSFASELLEFARSLVNRQAISHPIPSPCIP